MPIQKDVLHESYLVRLSHDTWHSPWRASLQKVGIGEWTHFARAEELWAYLETEMAKISNQPADPAGPGGQTTWRFCLVEPGDGETERGFASLEALLAHLRRELETGCVAGALCEVTKPTLADWSRMPRARIKRIGGGDVYDYLKLSQGCTVHC